MSTASDQNSDTPRVQYRPLVARPELCQDWQDEQEERNVTWPELFYDLFFVAAISNLGHLFKDAPDIYNAGRIVLYHAIMFFIWADYATLKTRYRLRGLLYRCIGLSLQLGTLAFIIGVRNDVQWHHLLAGGYALARAATSTAYSIIAATIPRARPLSLVHVSISGLLIVAAVCATVFRESYHTFHWLFIGVACTEAAIPLLPSVLVRRYDLPLHVEHMSERLGQLIMLHLGEAVIGFASSPLENTVPQFVAVALAAVLVWCLHLCYYHIEPDQHDHAYRQSRVRGLLFFYCHWPLAVSFLLTGTGLRLMLGLYPSGDNTASMLTAAAAAAAAAGTQQIVPMQPDYSRSNLMLGFYSNKELEPVAPYDISLLLCVSYAASLHLLALIRAAHYFSLDPEHRIVRRQERQGVKSWWNAWWATLWLWPVPVYFIPMAMKLATDVAVDSLDISNSSIDAGHWSLHNSKLGWHRWLSMDGTVQGIPAISSHIWGLVGKDSLSRGHGGHRTQQGLSVTALLLLLAAHAVILTLSESLFAHKITKMPIVAGLAASTDAEADDTETNGHGIDEELGVTGGSSEQNAARVQHSAEAPAGHRGLG